MRAAGFLCLALLAGCASVPVVEIPVTELALDYAEARAAYARAEVVLGAACKGERLDAETCASLRQAATFAAGLRARVEASLRDPKRPLDPAAIREYVGEATRLLGLAAGLAGGRLPGLGL